MRVVRLDIHRVFAEAMMLENRTIRRLGRVGMTRDHLTAFAATVRRYYYDTHDQLREHLAAFLDAYNFARRLKTLRGLTPYEATSQAWADDPSCFRYNPTQLTSS